MNAIFKQSIALFFCLQALSTAMAEDINCFPDTVKTKGGVNNEQEKQLKWNKAGANISWSFDLKEAGDYNLFAEMRCLTDKMKGGEFSIFIDGKPISTFVMPDTKNAFSPEKLTKNKVSLTSGKHTVSIQLDKVKHKRVGFTRNLLITQADTITEIIDTSFYKNAGSFAETLTPLIKSHSELSNAKRFDPIYKKLWADYPHQMAWLAQDLIPRDQLIANPKIDTLAYCAKLFAPGTVTQTENDLIERALSELPKKEQKKFRKKWTALQQEPAPSAKRLALYEQVCRARRKLRLKPLRAKTENIIFAKHQVFGSASGIYNITEREVLNPGETSGLFEVSLDEKGKNGFAETRLLINAEGGITRDPELSYNADTLYFAWRTSQKSGDFRNAAVPKQEENYQIYKMDMHTKAIQQLTMGDTYGSSFAPCVLPDGNIMFNSARIVQHITCGWGDHSNLFLMDDQGRYQRQIGFDQVSTEFPTVLNNGQVIYLRRDYNDRGQSAAHALFVTNPDGTAQTEYYGNQTGTPNSYMHPRPIPGSDKVACVLSGYHTRQGGQLALIDIRKGRNYGEGITQIPQGTKPPSSPGYDDGYLKGQVQYSDPYPLSETAFIVSRSERWGASQTAAGLGEHYGLYFMTADNRFELLAYDPTTSCLQAIPVMKRKKPQARPSMVDYTKDDGTYYVQNVYLGEAAQGIKPGTIKKIRIVELLYKRDTIGAGTSRGPGGAAHTVTPPAHPLAQFDARQILGTATVYEDGSAMFKIPARTPVYFQLLDDKNRCVQTMRSWTTLMPGENFSCVGCHENKTDTPVSANKTIAMSKGVETIEPFYGEPRGFSFMKEVQPVFDANCIQCHAEGKKGEKLVLTAEPFENAPAFGRKYAQSYVQLMAARPGPDPSVFSVWGGPDAWERKGKAQADEPNQYVQYWGRLREMKFKPPYFAGAIASGMIQKLEQGHHNVELSDEEWDKLVAWIDLNCSYCGDYMENNIWRENQVKQYERRIKEYERNRAIDAKNVNAFIEAGQP